jgi:lysophospholipase
MVLVLGGSVAWAKEPYPLSVPLPPGCPPPAYKQLEVLARDDAKLLVHEWSAPKRPAGKPVVLLLHGIGMHGEPYASIAAGFTVRDITLVVPDLRGHGRSQGKRGELAEPHVLRADLGAVIDLVQQRHPGAPLVLAGESMGGLLAADYAWRGEKRLAGLALLAPAFGIRVTGLELPPLRLQVPLRLPSADMNLLETVRISLEGANLTASTRVEGFVKALKADPLALHEVKGTYLDQLRQLQQAFPKAAAEIKTPLFIGVAGKDQIVDNDAARSVFARAGSEARAKTWRQWNEAYHTVCWDPLTPKMITELAQWAAERGK